MSGFKRRHLEQWVRDTLSDTQVVSYVVTGTGTPTTAQPGSQAPPGGDVRRKKLVELLGLDPDGQVGVGSATTFIVLTARQLTLGTRSSVRNRPKDLLHAAPAESARVVWFDHDAGGGNRFRHLVTAFGDGRWRSDFTGLTALGRKLSSSNADPFITALGNRATESTDV